MKAGKARRIRKLRKKITYGSAAEFPAAGLARYAEGVSAACGSDRHAEGSEAGGGGHAALVCSSDQQNSLAVGLRRWITVGVETLAAHAPCTEVIRTAREDPCVAGCDIVVERRGEGREDGGVGSERVGRVGGK